MKNKLSGFTLIELLVVISIIGLLSSVVLASLSGARESARDSRRQQDMGQIMTALEIYRNQHGHMPGWGSGCDFSSDSDYKSIAQKLSDPDSAYECMVDELASVMNGRVPTDPLAGEDDDFYYVYDNWHGNDGNRCDGVESVLIGFHASETGIDDRQTTTGGDQDMDNAAYNRVICLD